ncbi:hypothetical protein ACLOJK_011050 [Asimina triloba]
MEIDLSIRSMEKEIQRPASGFWVQLLLHGKSLVIQEVEVEPPQALEVRIKVKFTSLCHTDVSFWEPKGQAALFPRIFGHEASGIVESVGEGVTDLQVGDHVLPVFTGECKECRHCKSEESNMCDLLRINTDRGVMLNNGKSRFSINGKPIYHFLGTSTFSEYTVVHSGCVAKINPFAPLDKVCILSCGISTVPHERQLKSGKSSAEQDLAAEGAKILGASRIIGIDLNPQRFEQAKEFGVTEFINPKDHVKPVQEIIAEITNGGVDRSVECTGQVNAMLSAFECVHDGWGMAVLVGVPKKDDVFATHPMNVLNERTLKGTFFGNYKPRGDLPSELELEKFITHKVPFSEINKAFDYMIEGESLRRIISMEDLAVFHSHTHDRIYIPTQSNRIAVVGLRKVGNQLAQLRCYIGVKCPCLCVHPGLQPIILDCVFQKVATFRFNVL